MIITETVKNPDVPCLASKLQVHYAVGMAIAATQWTYLRNFIFDMHSPALILIQPADLDEVAVGHSFNDAHSLNL